LQHTNTNSQLQLPTSLRALHRPFLRCHLSSCFPAGMRARSKPGAGLDWMGGVCACERADHGRPTHPHTPATRLHGAVAFFFNPNKCLVCALCVRPFHHLNAYICCPSCNQHGALDHDWQLQDWQMAQVGYEVGLPFTERAHTHTDIHTHHNKLAKRRLREIHSAFSRLID